MPNSASTEIASTALPVVLLAATLHLYIGWDLMAKQLWTAVTAPDLLFGPVPCIVGSCLEKTATCFSDRGCRNTLLCINKCTITQPREKIAACAYICEMTDGYENGPFLDLIGCMVNNGCMSDYPRDGICLGKDEDAVQTIDNLEKVAGDWWVIAGLNCGRGVDYPGGYDWYPCQHERFVRHEPSGQWINNVTYCAGKGDVCLSNFIVTVANVTLPRPGVIKHEYTDAPLSPQEEFWRVISWPDQGDYMFILWCGRLPVLEYNGGIVLARKRQGKDMPESVKKEFRMAADKYGIDYNDDLCPSDNTHCSF